MQDVEIGLQIGHLDSMSEIVFRYSQHFLQRFAVLEHSSNIGQFSVINIMRIRTFEDSLVAMEAVVRS